MSKLLSIPEGHKLIEEKLDSERANKELNLLFA